MLIMGSCDMWCVIEWRKRVVMGRYLRGLLWRKHPVNVHRKPAGSNHEGIRVLHHVCMWGASSEQSVLAATSVISTLSSSNVSSTVAGVAAVGAV